MGELVYYVGFYDTSNNRVSSLAAVNKMNYINKKLIELGYKTKFISPSWITRDSTKKIVFKKRDRIVKSEDKTVIFSPSFRPITKLGNYINIGVSLLWLFFYLIVNVKKNDKVIMYHSPWLSVPIKFSKKLIKFELILEVEEIYQDISIPFRTFKKWEDTLLPIADKYIYSTDLLQNRINSENEYCVLYGDYGIPVIEDNLNISNNIIKLVYAGIIDSSKRGAFNAIESAKYLNENYILHIIGFGEVDKLLKIIKHHNELYSCKIYYDGSLSGDNYINYMSKMDIGLSTQNIEGVYLESSFPSKILSYLGLGLRVVSGDIEAVKISRIGDLVSYYHGNNPKNIAQSIKKINLEEEYNSRKKLLYLDKEFKECLNVLMF